MNKNTFFAMMMAAALTMTVGCKQDNETSQTEGVSTSEMAPAGPIEVPQVGSETQAPQENSEETAVQE